MSDSNQALDHEWLQIVRENRDKYKIIVDNDSIWIEAVDNEGECFYTFSLYGYEFIHWILNDMGIDAEFC